MKNRTMLLLKTLNRSTSSLNILKTSGDKKKKQKIIASYVGFGLIYILIVVYAVMSAYGYAQLGLVDKLPMLTALLLCTLAFLLTLFKAGSYLFGFREYEMLMALPFSEKTIVSSKFLYMYVKSLPFNMAISVAMLIGYGIFNGPAIYVYPLWIVLSAVLLVIPMLAASFFGFLIAKIGTAFKHWKVVQTILTLVFVMICFSLRFIIEKLFRNGEVKTAITDASKSIDMMGTYYPPMAWFEKAIVDHNILSAILLVVVTAVVFEIVFYILSRSYKKMNSVMRTGAAKRSGQIKIQKKKSKERAIAVKELRRLVSSTNYFVNIGIGYILAIVVSVLALVIGVDKIIQVVVNGAPVTSQMILPAIPFVIYFLTGMVPMTTCSPSLEGKNYWILQSSPLTNRDIYFGKLLASLYISVPVQLFATIMFCISAKASVLETIFFMILGFVLCVFSSSFGLACGIHFMKLEWENEIEVIKQGTAVVVYMFPNMILTCAMLFGSIFLSKVIGIVLVSLIIALVYVLLSLIVYLRVKSLCRVL